LHRRLARSEHGANGADSQFRPHHIQVPACCPFTALAEKKRLWSGPAHSANIRRVAFSADGLRAASVSHDKTAIVWNAADGKQLQTLKGHTAQVMSVVFDPNGKHILTGSEGADGTIRRICCFNRPSPDPLAKRRASDSPTAT
jgi:WD40 repeat protein